MTEIKKLVLPSLSFFVTEKQATNDEDETDLIEPISDADLEQ